MADEILDEVAAKEAAAAKAKQEAALAAERKELEGELYEGLLTDEELADLGKKNEAKRAEELKKLEEIALSYKNEDPFVNEGNLASLLYTSSKLELDNNEAKAAELSFFLKSLLKPGIYPSVEAAYEDGVPVGTFVIVDDPETEENEFTVKAVTEPFEVVSEESLSRRLKEEAEKALQAPAEEA